MKGIRGKKILALGLALCLFLTSGFFMLFKLDVFGAVNYDRITDYNYVNVPDNERGTYVYVRGAEDCERVPDIVLTNEGSNVKGKVPDVQYASWDPNVSTDGTKTSDDLPVVPGTEGAKGTEDNPFVILEVVPDKGMQELSYFAGDKDSGLPFDAGELNASMMMAYRYRHGSTFYFTNPLFKNNNAETIKGKIGNFLDTLKNDFGEFGLTTQYSVKHTGGNKKDKLPAFDCLPRSDENKTGSFNIHQIYNLKITDDDLLNTYPTYVDPTDQDYLNNLTENGVCYYKNDTKYITRNPEKDYKYKEVRDEKTHYVYNENGGIVLDSKSQNTPKDPYVSGYVFSASNTLVNKSVYNETEYNSVRSDYKNETDVYFTSDLVALARADSDYKIENGNKVLDEEKEPTQTQVESFIKNTLMSDDYKLNCESVKSTSAPSKVAYHNTEIVKYNLVKYVAKTYTFRDENAQDVCPDDLDKSGEFDMYDVANGIIQRGRGQNAPMAYYTHNSLGLTNYWKVRFRKYYYDHFQELYKNFTDAQAVYEAAAKNGTEDGNATGFENKLNARNAALRRLFREYEPLFTRKGFKMYGKQTTVNSKALLDTYDWEVTDKNVLSNVRKYVTNPIQKKADGTNAETTRNGGAILAVKPGRGDMWLLTDDEANDAKLDNSKVIFTRDESLVKGTTDEKASRKRWLYAPCNWSMTGYMEPSDGSRYRPGYLDDADYTVGFFSKSFVSKSNYWISVYDKLNRRYHATDSDLWKRMLFRSNEQTTNMRPNYFRNPRGTEYWDANWNNPEYSDWNACRVASRSGYSGVGRVGRDDYHLNVWDQMLSSYGISNNGQRQSNIKDHDNLINGSNSGGASWYGWRNEKYENFLFSTHNGNIDLTGFCFSFNPADVYDSAENDRISSGRSFTNEDKVNPVDTTQISVQETSKEYNFIYYGFDSNDILKKTLFDFEATDEEGDESDIGYEDFCYKVIVVTPEEMNRIAKRAKEYNSAFDSDKDKVQNAEVDAKLDLAERADMFYIHTHKTKSVDAAEDYVPAYRFYRTVVLGKDIKKVNEDKDQNNDKGDDKDVIQSGQDIKQFNRDLLTYYQNDLEWDQVMKLIKRSSLKTGTNIPFLFNGVVNVMTEETVEPQTTNTTYNTPDMINNRVWEKINDQAQDTLNYLYQGTNKNMCEQIMWSGNINNITKLFLIMFQFDLHIKYEKKNSDGEIIQLDVPVKDPKGNKIQYETGELDNHGNPIKKDRMIERIFMRDIFPWIRSVPKDDMVNIVNSQKSYGVNGETPSENNTDATPRFTGYIKSTDDFDYNDTKAKRKLGDDITEYKRKLSSGAGDAFLRNTLSLWNRFTFYPADEKLDKDKWDDYVAWGYLYNFWSEAYHGKDIFGVEEKRANKWRFGSDGEDGQNVFIYHVSNENNLSSDEADNIISNKQADDAIAVDKFLNTAYKILHLPGEPEKIKVYVRPSDNNQYSLMGRTDKDKIESEDEILLDYSRLKSNYSPSRLAELQNKKIYLKVSLFNANDKKDDAYITRIYKRKQVGKDSEDKPVYEDVDILPIDKEIGQNISLLKGKTGSDEVIIDATDTKKVIPMSDDCETEAGPAEEKSWKYDAKDTEAGETHDWLKIAGGGTHYYRIPYNLSDFFVDSEDQESFDQIVIEGEYLFETASKSFQQFKFKHTIHINEEMLPMLE